MPFTMMLIMIVFGRGERSSATIMRINIFYSLVTFYFLQFNELVELEIVKMLVNNGRNMILGHKFNERLQVWMQLPMNLFHFQFAITLFAITMTIALIFIFIFIFIYINITVIYILMLLFALLVLLAVS